MAAFVLIHGAWHGGWCWSDVAQTGHDAMLLVPDELVSVLLAP